MKFSEFVTRNHYAWLKDVIPLLQQIYVNAHSWNVDDTIEEVFEKKKRHVRDTVLVHNIENEVIKGKLEYSYCDDKNFPYLDENGQPCEVLDCARSYIIIKSLIDFIVKDIKDLNCIPDELLVVAGIKASAKKATSDQGKVDPTIATELGTLRNEKLKWDASIRAAAEIGLLFFEGELPKPTTKDAFVKEFNSKVGGLPDTTVEMIYKALPSEYRHKGGKPKVSRTESAAIAGVSDLNISIKAAVYAGSIYDERDAKDVSRLATMLKNNNYELPPEAVLQKIVEYVKDI